MTYIPEPILTPGEKAVVKGYGGWQAFMLSYGLKPWEEDDAEEGLQIVRGLAQVDEENE